MNNKKILFATCFLALFFLFGSTSVFAYTIEELNFTDEGDIVVGPGKTEVLLDPGDEYTKEIIVSNRSGSDKIIDISVEDFQGSKDPEITVEFLGTEKGPYSLKNYVKSEISQITLKHGQRLHLPVLISIPQDAQPGGLYGAVMVSASNVLKEGEQKTAVAGQLRVITRIASLFFVKVSGTVFNNGSLQSFKAEKSFYEKGPVVFQITSENKGSVYLSPYGVIEIKNILGSKIDERQIDPWFVLPNSVRVREIKWNSNFLFGRYVATLHLNRGYDDIIDTQSISFWVVPWKILSIILIGLILIIWFFVWIFSHLQWKTIKPDISQINSDANADSAKNNKV